MSKWNRLSDIRLWELTSNSTRWDIASASPSDDVLHTQFAILATINAIVALSCLLSIISILRTSKVRERAFNCYLLTITFPDFVSSFCCLITCAMSSSISTYYSEMMCGWQTFYLTWGFSSSCWMNAVIAHELTSMLSVSHARGRYDPPTRKMVAFGAMCVYSYSALIASLATWNIIPLFKGGSYQGFACMPKDYDNASTIFFWLAFIPAMMLIPMGYVLWCVGKIFWKGMIPPVGRRRNLAVYFFRLIFVFVVMWLPFIVITFAYGPATAGADSPWVLWAGTAWSHLQGLVSVLVSLAKPDIKECFIETITFGRLCCKGGQEEEHGDTEITNSSTDQPPPERKSRSYSIMRSFRALNGESSRFSRMSSASSSRNSSSIYVQMGSVAQESQMGSVAPTCPEAEDAKEEDPEQQTPFPSEQKISSSLPLVAIDENLDESQSSRES